MSSSCWRRRNVEHDDDESAQLLRLATAPLAWAGRRPAAALAGARLYRDHAARRGQVRGGQGFRLPQGGPPAAHLLAAATLYGFIPRTYCGGRVARLAPGST